MIEENNQQQTIDNGHLAGGEAKRTRWEIWTRVMGYFRPTDNFNIGKKQEFKDRKYYKIEETTGKLSTERKTQP